LNSELQRFLDIQEPEFLLFSTAGENVRWGFQSRLPQFQLINGSGNRPQTRRT